MRNVFLLTALSVLTVASANAQVTTVVLARTGMRTDRPHTQTYHFVEVIQSRGKWIFPDVGYMDFGHGDYHEVFIGAGRTVYDGKRLTLTQELYFDQAFGPDSDSARYLLPFSGLQFRFSPKLAANVAYVAYAPLSSGATAQHVLDSAKLEYALSKSWKAGAGYGGYKFGSDPWQNTPFVTTTLSGKAGSLELWLQRMPAGAQVQFRYTVVR